MGLVLEGLVFVIHKLQLKCDLLLSPRKKKTEINTEPCTNPILFSIKSQGCVIIISRLVCQKQPSFSVDKDKYDARYALGSLFFLLGS